ncbi:MAG: hypothetical protein ACPGYP_00505 [Solirubrobacterales bacterium]
MKFLVQVRRFRRHRLVTEDGQSLVELVAITPIVLVCGMLGLQGLVVGANAVAADHSAHAAALAKQLGTDPVAAARAAIPGWSHGDVRVQVGAGRVQVRLTPKAILPGLARMLEPRAEARFVGGLSNQQWSPRGPA